MFHLSIDIIFLYDNNQFPPPGLNLRKSNEHTWIHNDKYSVTCEEKLVYILIRNVLILLQKLRSASVVLVKMGVLALTE